jgi:hypothetical protein
MDYVDKGKGSRSSSSWACWYVCIYVYIRTYTQACIYVYIHTYTHAYSSSWACWYVCIYVHTYIHTSMYIRVYTYVHTCILFELGVLICVYIRTHVHTHQHAYMHTYTHAYSSSWACICTHVLYLYTCIHTHSNVRTLPESMYVCLYKWMYASINGCMPL